MADFRMISSQLHLAYLADARTFALDPGSTGELALFGGGPNGEALEVRAVDPGMVQVVAVSSQVRGSDLRSVRVKANRIGATALEARTSDGGSWARADFAVGFTPGRMIAATQVPTAGEVPFVVGIASVVRIPVPGTSGLCIEFGHRGWSPKTGSTSTLFVQDMLGKRNLRLDYGYNVKTGTINFHWNQKGTFPVFGIVDHTPVGSVGQVVYRSARYFKYAGRSLAVVGVVTASKPLRQASKVVSGWGGAGVGCKLVGAGGAWVGTAVSPGMGTALGGVAGCVAGGFLGYEGGSRAAGRLYDWADATFVRVPDTAAP